MGLVSSFINVVAYIFMTYVILVTAVISNVFQIVAYLLMRPFSLTVYRKVVSFFHYLSFSLILDYSFSSMHRRIPIEEIPEDDEACAKYCHELYRIKDTNYEYFERHGRFPEKTYEIPRRPHSVLVFISVSVLLAVPPMKCLLDVILTGSMYMIAGVVLGGLLGTVVWYNTY
uniref:Acyltransferase C-terminal domain-containing protein n=1 Tax=Branchiostoma floridae TaxID=7739 RepID=C4A0R0_BRAFL|eukprot:XP_002585604.1 hypothetical protein BRAFLDRAFT_111731 [Branchiostoma floridae]